MTEKWLRADRSQTDSLDGGTGVAAAAIESAFNTGAVVEIPPGILPGGVEDILLLQKSVQQLLEDPTPEEQETMKGMNEEEKEQFMRDYVLNYAADRGLRVKDEETDQFVNLPQREE